MFVAAAENRLCRRPTLLKLAGQRGSVPAVDHDADELSWLYVAAAGRTTQRRRVDWIVANGFGRRGRR